MLGMYEQHNNLLQLLSQTTGHESLIEEYRAWIVQGNELAWPGDREEWEKQGYALLAQIGEVFGPSTVQTTLTVTKDAFLYQALEEMDGFDGVLLPQDFYNYIVRRDGTCSYSVDELETWLNEEE